MHIRFPKWLQVKLNSAFAARYKINLSEAEKSIEEYLSIGDFFIRKLKAGVRPIGDGEYVHPADSKLTARGIITQGQMIQAKGRRYSVEQFLSVSSAAEWLDGYFLTYYLCPTDYHRVHSPVEGWIKEVRYIPGMLWPVNDWSVANIDQLFIKNERVVVEIMTIKGPIEVVFVGATNVGSIKLSFEPMVQTNHTHQRVPQNWRYSENAIKVKKGEELGMFCMGSTVIVVTNKNWPQLSGLAVSSNAIAVKVGSAEMINQA